MLRRIRRRRKNKNLPLSRFYLLLVLILLLFFPYLTSYSKSLLKSAFFSRSEMKLISVKSLGEIVLMPSPLPTATPTPTPVPLVGYCLKVPILMYHHIQPASEAVRRGQTALSVDSGQFDLQMGYLVGNGYTLITVKQLVDALKTHSGLPSKSIAVTMDDGYNDIYTYVYPVLQKYHVVANLAIITGLLGGADYLTWGQVSEMVHSGLAYVTDHTWSHHAVTSGSVDKIKSEIEIAKQQLQDATGQTVDVFTYPYGSFNANAFAILANDGFVGAISEVPGHWQCDSFLMTLHRTRIGNAPLSYYGL